MTRAAVLDTGPLGLATNPNLSPQSLACAQWIENLVDQGVRVIVPEIADYELRRELLRADKQAGLRRLDELIGVLEFLPITTAAMRRAAEFWAQARRAGLPTAPDPALDADAILAAQAMTLGEPDVVVATTNVGHLSLFAPARLWREVGPSG